MSLALIVGPYPLYRLGVANLLRDINSSTEIIEAPVLADIPPQCFSNADGLLLCGQSVVPPHLAQHLRDVGCRRSTRRVLFTDHYGESHRHLQDRKALDLVLPLSVNLCRATYYLRELLLEPEAGIWIAARHDGALMNEFLPDLTDLTRREQKLLKLLQQGLSNSLIAEQMAININTVKVHMAKICRKTGIRNRTHAVSLCDQILCSGL